MKKNILFLLLLSSLSLPIITSDVDIDTGVDESNEEQQLEDEKAKEEQENQDDIDYQENKGTGSSTSTDDPSGDTGTGSVDEVGENKSGAGSTGAQAKGSLSLEVDSTTVIDDAASPAEEQLTDAQRAEVQSANNILSTDPNDPNMQNNANQSVAELGKMNSPVLERIAEFFKNIGRGFASLWNAIANAFNNAALSNLRKQALGELTDAPDLSKERQQQVTNVDPYNLTVEQAKGVLGITSENYTLEDIQDARNDRSLQKFIADSMTPRALSSANNAVAVLEDSLPAVEETAAPPEDALTPTEDAPPEVGKENSAATTQNNYNLPAEQIFSIENDDPTTLEGAKAILDLPDNFTGEDLENSLSNQDLGDYLKDHNENVETINSAVETILNSQESFSITTTDLDPNRISTIESLESNPKSMTLEQAQEILNLPDNFTSADIYDALYEDDAFIDYRNNTPSATPVISQALFVTNYYLTEI